MWSCLLAFPVNDAPSVVFSGESSSKAGDKSVSMLGCGRTNLCLWPCLSSGLGLLCRTSNATANMLPTNYWGVGWWWWQLFGLPLHPPQGVKKRTLVDSASPSFLPTCQNKFGKVSSSRCVFPHSPVQMYVGSSSHLSGFYLSNLELACLEPDCMYLDDALLQILGNAFLKLTWVLAT